MNEYILFLSENVKSQRHTFAFGFFLAGWLAGWPAGRRSDISRKRFSYRRPEVNVLSMLCETRPVFRHRELKNPIYFLVLLFLRRKFGKGIREEDQRGQKRAKGRKRVRDERGPGDERGRE